MILPARSRCASPLLRCLLFAAVCLTHTSAHAEARFYHLGILDDAPTGNFYSYSSGVSADGNVVTGFSGDAFDDWPFRWTREAGMEMLRPLPPMSQTVLAQAISSDGSVIVGGNDPGVFRWNEVNGLEPLGEPGQAYAISSNGDVIAGETNGHAFLWTEETGFVSIGGQGSIAKGISADGSIVVGRTENGEAFRWTEESGAVGLGRLDPDGDSTALAISADGSVIVGTSELAEGGSLAFRWTEATSMVALETPPGTVISQALAISADGLVVVGMGARSPTNPMNRDALLWNAQGDVTRMIDMLTDDFDLELSGFNLEVANGISADGNVIVGWGNNDVFRFEAWLVTLNVPEPNGFCGMSIGIVTLAGLRRRWISK